MIVRFWKQVVLVSASITLLAAIVGCGNNAAVPDVDPSKLPPPPTVQPKVGGAPPPPLGVNPAATKK